MWSHFYTDGGFGMYPTSIFGFLLVVTSFLYLFRPESRYVPIVLCCGFLTLGAGVLGTATGLVNTFRYLQNVAIADQVKIAGIGCAESLNNIVLALIISIFAALPM